MDEPTSQKFPTRIYMFQKDKDVIKNHRPAAIDAIRKTFPDELPPDGQYKFSVCKVEIAPEVFVRVSSVANHIFVDGGSSFDNQWFAPWGSSEDVEDPFVKIEVVGNAETRRIESKRLDSRWGFRAAVNARNETVTHGYLRFGPPVHSHEKHNFNSFNPSLTYTPYAYLNIRVTAPDGTQESGFFKSEQPRTGIARLVPDSPTGEVRVESNFFGMRQVWTEHLGTVTKRVENLSRYDDNHFKNNPLRTLYTHLNGSDVPDGADAWWDTFFKLNVLSELNTKGIAAMLKRKTVKPNIERLQKESQLDWTFFCWLTSSRTVDKKSNNSLLSAMLKEIGHDYERLVAALRHARNEVALTTSPSQGWNNSTWFESRRSICLTLPGAAEKVQEQEAKADWSKQQGNAKKADGLGIEENRFPKLRSAIEKGDIPTSVFRQPNDTPVNREFSLWERALTRKGWADVIYEISKNAGRRGTYEKDITPYLSFLFRIEKFLKKHSKKNWKAVPKFVQSQWELEMDETNETGTTKRRSAFTPVADNETGIVTVPYVAVSVSGVRTQWCYARHYHIFEEGFTDPESEGIVVNDLEENLNGRDDYGLCFYTLTGTVTARGYPTFLIIFERLSSGTRVHFHRVRPQRKKNGRPTPACELVEACYQYMAGNVPASEVEAQQGDLIFIRHPNNPVKAGAKVKEPQEAINIEFESHRFSPLGVDSPMKLYESEAKTPKNRLGFLFAQSGFKVSHPEHDDISGLLEGWWEIRRCRSWEANPHAIWSLTID